MWISAVDRGMDEGKQVMDGQMEGRGRSEERTLTAACGPGCITTGYFAGQTASWGGAIQSAVMEAKVTVHSCKIAMVHYT